VVITNSRVSGNSATSTSGSAFSGGGGISKFGSSALNIINSTISGNTASGVTLGIGGGIYNQTTGIVNITNSTLSGNTSSGSNGDGTGGGLVNVSTGTVNITNCTIAYNSVNGSTNGNGGGVANQSTGIVNVKNTIVASNTAAGVTITGLDVKGNFTSQGYNLIGKNDGSTGFTNGVNEDQVGSIATPLNPRIGPLVNNGGMTMTHRLLPFRVNTSE
jgi:hypothetical protein